MSDDLEMLVVALAHLRERYGVNPGYNRLYAAGMDGTIPVQRVGRRLYLAKVDYPSIAEWARRPARRRTLTAA